MNFWENGLLFSGTAALMYIACVAVKHRKHDRLIENVEDFSLPFKYIFLGFWGMLFFAIGIIKGSPEFWCLSGGSLAERKSWDSEKNVPSMQRFNHRGRATMKSTLKAPECKKSR